MRATSVFVPRAVFSIARFVILPFVLATIWCSASAAQEVPDAQPFSMAGTSPRPLITQSIDEAHLTTLRGNIHPLARPEFDLGTAPASLPMQRMLLVLKRSEEQESALRKLLDDQQDKASPNYHKWLTPEQYGQQYGPTDADLQTVTAWLQSHGFQVGTTKGRTVLEFSGSASQVQEAFHTTIHKYIVNGEQHWANAGDPSIPSALTPAVAGIGSLHNFPRKPMSQILGKFSRERATGKLQPIEPLFTLPSGCTESYQSNDPCYYGLGPYDFATIYNVLPLWTAGINGTGQTIAIVGETNINLQDVRDFRRLFGLPSNDPQIILNGPDPGIQGDEVEANLDLQWSGAVAPNATIDFVISQSTETTAGVDLSAVYIVENNLAPVMSESYGECELGLGTTGNQFFNALWQQAAAQGITVFISSGDGGSAGCDNFNAASPAPAQFGLQVSGFASTPYNVAVGGTDFDDFFNPSTYWKTMNDPTTQASAKSYIPETTWNSTCTNAIFGKIGYSTNAETNCNDSRVTPYWDVPLGGSGGASNCTTSDGSTTTSCAGGYAKPSWQTGNGVPKDGKRDIPDVSLFASPGFLLNFYIVCQADVTPGPCSLAPTYYFLAAGGTSASSPAFAGIMALVNQQMALQGLSSRQGNANYVFYKLAAQQPTAFHDVTSGTIAMPCLKGSPNCTTTNSSHQYGVLTGYTAGTGYDLATGLGSVNVQNLVTKWSSVVSLASTTTLNSLTPTTITHGQSVNFNVTVAPKTGSGTPAGTVSLLGGPSNSSEGIAGFNLTSGTFSGSTDLLPGGTYSVTAHYPGDSTYGPSDSGPISVTVGKENSQPQISLVTFDTTGHIINGNTTTAPYGSPYLLRVDVANAGAHVCSPVAASGATACPSGTVSLTNNGTTLDAGTYALNNYGYAEDLTVQLPGGTDSVKANYSGDDSFNTSSATNAISITPAPTTMPALTGPTWTILAGSSTWFYATVQSSSSGVVPSGTVTLYANGTALPAAVSSWGTAGSPYQGASLTAFFQPTFTTSGTKTITASYGGDSNYGASSSPAISVSVLYPTTEAISSSAQIVSSGTTVTLTALVDTTQKNIPVTGTFTFYSTNGVLNATPTIKQVTDSSGYSALQATLTVTINSTIDFSFHYSGDSNYVEGQSNDIQIGVPDFYMSPTFGYVTMSAGQSQQLAVNISDLYGFNGAVTNFACSGLPADTTCSFSPDSVTGSGSTTMTITTTALGQSRARTLRASNRPWWPTWVMAAFGICLVGVSRRGRHNSALALVLCLSLLAFLGCGGSSSYGGGGGGGTSNPKPSISSLAPGSLAAGSNAQSLTINGSGFISSSAVAFNGLSHQPSYMSANQLSVWLTAADLSGTGTFPVTVTNSAPGGGTSAAVNFNVVTGTPSGTFPVSVTATGAGFTHTFTFTLVIQ